MTNPPTALRPRPRATGTMTAGGAGGTAAAAVQPRTIPGGLHPLNRGALSAPATGAAADLA